MPQCLVDRKFYNQRESMSEDIYDEYPSITLARESG
ncbi:transcriptional regulator, partial [Vibrio cholerae]